MGIANAALDGIWNTIATVCHGVKFETPAKRSTFTVANVRPDTLVITLKSGEPLTMGKAAFEDALHYLVEHGHHQGMPCEIRSNLRVDDAGPLCRVVRTNGTVNVPYVLPILKKMGLLDIDPGTSGRVSTTWYIA